MTSVFLFLSDPLVYFRPDYSLRSAKKFTVEAAGIMRGTCKHDMSTPLCQEVMAGKPDAPSHLN